MSMRRDLPLRRSGGQVRRQPIRRSSPRLRVTQIYALVLMVLCVMAVVSLGGSPVFAARHLEVHGATFTGDRTVSAIVGMDGSPNLFRFRSDRVAAALTQLPAVASARVEVRLPDTVVVTILERKPSMVWVIGDRRYVVDDNGFLFGEVDTAGNPVYPAPGGSATAPTDNAGSTGGPTTSSSPDEGSSGEPAATPPGGTPGASAGKGATSAPKAPSKATPNPKASPKKATPTPLPTPVPSPTSSLGPPPSLLPVPTPDPAQTPGPQVVTLPAVYDRRAQDAGLTLGDSVDSIALDAGYRLAGLTPADAGSSAQSLAVVLDDDHGFTVSSGADGWVDQFGFYTETLRKDDVIPQQVQDLRSMLVHYGEAHVAWVFLVADIAGNRIDTYIPR